MTKPNCYECRWRRDCVGSAHSKCVHPEIGSEGKDPANELMAIFASVGRAPPVSAKAAEKLDIRANRHGLVSGWFNWPWNFDPVWLENCNGFTEKEGQKKEA